MKVKHEAKTQDGAAWLESTQSKGIQAQTTQCSYSHHGLKDPITLWEDFSLGEIYIWGPNHSFSMHVE